MGRIGAGAHFSFPRSSVREGPNNFQKREGNRRAHDVDAPTGKRFRGGTGRGARRRRRARAAAERRTGESGRTESRFGGCSRERVSSVSLARPRRDPRAAHARALASPPPPRPRRASTSPSEAKLFSAKLLSAKLLSAELCLRGRRRVRPVDPRRSHAAACMTRWARRWTRCARARVADPRRGRAPRRQRGAAAALRGGGERGGVACRCRGGGGAARRGAPRRARRRGGCRVARARACGARWMRPRRARTPRTPETRRPGSPGRRLSVCRRRRKRWSSPNAPSARRFASAGVEAARRGARRRRRAGGAGAGKRALRVWASRTKRNKRARASRRAHGGARLGDSTRGARARARDSCDTVQTPQAAAAAAAPPRLAPGAAGLGGGGLPGAAARSGALGARDGAAREVRAAFAEAAPPPPTTPPSRARHLRSASETPRASHKRKRKRKRRRDAWSRLALPTRRARARRMSFWRGARARPPRRCLRENAGRRWTSTRTPFSVSAARAASAARCAPPRGGGRCPPGTSP